MTGPERRIYFEAMVLHALWVIIRMLVTQKPDWQAATDFRVTALTYLDYHGSQVDGAKDYRREKRFPDLPWGSR